MSTITDTEKTALDRAIDVMGTQQALADALGIKSPSISEWWERGVPSGRVLAIERATGGQVTRHELRPDLYPKDSAA